MPVFASSKADNEVVRIPSNLRLTSPREHWKKIAENGCPPVDTVLKRSYETTPVSNLFLNGRKEDLAFEHLKPLEWLIGQWKGGITFPDDYEDVTLRGLSFTINGSFEWMQNKNAIQSTIKMTDAANTFVFTSHDVIGWNPLTRKVDFAYFNSLGGRGTGTHTFDGKMIVLEFNGIDPKGDFGVSTRRYEPLDDNTMVIKDLGRYMNGRRQATLPPLTFARTP